MNPAAKSPPAQWTMSNQHFLLSYPSHCLIIWPLIYCILVIIFPPIYALRLCHIGIELALLRGGVFFFFFFLDIYVPGAPELNYGGRGNGVSDRTSSSSSLGFCSFRRLCLILLFLLRTLTLAFTWYLQMFNIYICIAVEWRLVSRSIMILPTNCGIEWHRFASYILRNIL